LYRTVIRNGMRDGSNFNGKYSIIGIGCGTECGFFKVADVTTGRVTEFPLGGEDYGTLHLYYRLDSSLVIAAWHDYDGGHCFQEAFKMNKGLFISLERSSAPHQERSEACDPHPGALPDAMMGNWCYDKDYDYRRGACSSPDSDGKLIVERDGYYGHEESCTFNKIMRFVGEVAFWIEERCYGEGMSWKGKVIFNIADDKLRVQEIMHSNEVLEEHQRGR
jgi:hypothetical protein